MAELNTIKGHWLCGKGTINAIPSELHVGPCHCESCMRWASGPFFAIDCKSNVTIKGEKWIKAYNSSDWAERGFCSQCGTNLFYRLKEQNHYMLAVGIFDNQSSFVMDHQVFIDEKPSFYNFSERTKNMTGEECFAQFNDTQE